MPLPFTMLPCHILYSFKGCVLSNKKPVGGRPIRETGSKWKQKPVLRTPRPQDGPYQLQVSTHAWSQGNKAWSNWWRPYFRTFLPQESWQLYLPSWPWLFPQWWCPSSLPQFQRPQLWPKRRAWRARLGVGTPVRSRTLAPAPLWGPQSSAESAGSQDQDRNDLLERQLTQSWVCIHEWAKVGLHLLVWEKHADYYNSLTQEYVTMVQYCT